MSFTSRIQYYQNKNTDNYYEIMCSGPKLGSDIEKLVHNCSHFTVCHPKLSYIVDYGIIAQCNNFILIIMKFKVIRCLIFSWSRLKLRIPMHSAMVDTTINALCKFVRHQKKLWVAVGHNLQLMNFKQFMKGIELNTQRPPGYFPASNGATESVVTVVKHAVQKMGTATPLNIWLACFPLVYHITADATAEMWLDKLFIWCQLCIIMFDSHSTI